MRYQLAALALAMSLCTTSTAAAASIDVIHMPSFVGNPFVSLNGLAGHTVFEQGATLGRNFHAFAMGFSWDLVRYVDNITGTLFFHVEGPPVSLTSVPGSCGSRHFYTFEGGYAELLFGVVADFGTVTGRWTAPFVGPIQVWADDECTDPLGANRADSEIEAQFGEGLFDAAAADHLGIGFRRTKGGYLIFGGDHTNGTLETGHELSTNGASLYITVPEPFLLSLLIPGFTAGLMRRRRNSTTIGRPPSYE